MRKLTIPAVALGVLTFASMGLSDPASAADGDALEGANVAQQWPMQDDGANDDDDDDDDGEELAYTQAPSRSGEAASAADELPATGANTSSIALIGALALAAGGAM